MSIPLAWKVLGAGIGLVAAGFAWNGVSRYLATRHADEIIEESARTAVMEAQQAEAQARQRHDDLAANLRQRREELATNYRQVDDQARAYQGKRAVQLALEQQETKRIAASYMLDASQQCAGGIVIDRRGSSFTQKMDKDGRPIRCQGSKAAQPLR
ncbi:MAG: hypothetical protein ABI178_02510 [Rhodanobacter sp.]